jgi:hypothetical protein
MTRALLPLLICLMPQLAQAANSSVYTSFDLDACTQTAPADDTVFEGSWRCKGIAGYDVFQAGEDARGYAGFGKDEAGNCASRKTFYPFNTPLSPIEWRMAAGKPLAAIERWSTTDGEGVRASWLVVSALKDGMSCHMHYVAGSFPDANEAARKAADERAPGFDCMTAQPTYDSTIGPPPIDLKSCMELETE